MNTSQVLARQKLEQSIECTYTILVSADLLGIYLNDPQLAEKVRISETLKLNSSIIPLIDVDVLSKYTYEQCLALYPEYYV